LTRNQKKRKIHVIASPDITSGRSNLNLQGIVCPQRPQAGLRGGRVSLHSQR
jgi:hypothetical protein